MLLRILGLTLILFTFAPEGLTQSGLPTPRKGRAEIEEDTTPPLLNNLPDAETVRKRAVFIRNAADLSKTLGNRNFFELLNFEGGNYGATANYPEGTLLVFEFATPQTSIEADRNLVKRFAEVPQNPAVYYRRVGNYAVFVLDSPDPVGAASLIDRVKYEKSVQWLGTNPYEEEQYLMAERKYLKSAADLAISTVLFIVVGLSSTVLLGILVGYLVFTLRARQRLEMTTFSDAGGMTRLNLDGLSESPSKKLLSD